MNTQTGIDTELDLAKNMFGSLSQDMRKRLRAVYDNPTVETWDAAHDIIIGGDRWMTLWQAVVAVDPTFPQLGPSEDRKGNRLSDWKQIPDRELIRAALYFATH